MSSLFLGCFSFGLLFTVASFLLGAFGSGDHLHLHGAHVDAGSAEHGNGGAGHWHVSPFNLSTISAFLAWFGGAGYLLTRYSSFTALAVTLIATVVGVAGGLIVFLALARYLLPRLTVLEPGDFELQGVVARVTSTIQPGGTGEIVYSLGGTRHSDGARSTTSEALERGAEVVILRMEKGIAYVERWAKFADAHHLPPDTGAV